MFIGERIDSSSNKWGQDNWAFTSKIMGLDTYLILYTTINSESEQGPEWKSINYNSYKKNTGLTFHALEFGSRFLNRETKTWVTINK